MIYAQTKGKTFSNNSDLHHSVIWLLLAAVALGTIRIAPSAHCLNVYIILCVICALLLMRILFIFACRANWLYAFSDVFGCSNSNSVAVAVLDPLFFCFASKMSAWCNLPHQHTEICLLSYEYVCVSLCSAATRGTHHTEMFFLILPFCLFKAE